MKTSLLRDTIIYGISNAVYSGLPFILLPLFTYLLSPDDYALIDLYKNLSLILIPLLGLSTVQSIVRFYYDLNILDFRKLIASILYLHIFNGFVGIFIIFSVSYFLNDYSDLLFYCVLFFCSNQIIEILLSIYRVENKPYLYFIIRISNVVLDLILLYFFYYYFEKLDWTFRVLPSVISSLILAFVVLIILYKRSFFLSFDYKILKPAILFSLPLILHMISGYIFNIGDRFFILRYLSKDDLGNYAVAYQFGMLSNFIFSSFNIAWVPFFFKNMKINNIVRINKIKTYIYCGIIFVAITLLFFSYFFINYTNFFNNYDINFNIVIIISLSYILVSFYKLESNYLFFYKMTGRLSYITIGIATLTIIFNIILIPIYGIIGAAYTTLICSFIMFILIKFIINSINVEISKNNF